MSQVKRVNIKLSKSDLNAAQDFTDRRASQGSNLYKRRGGFKQVDILCGALGELAAFKYLTEEAGRRVSKPDFSIHEIKSKSFNADLTDSTGNLYHVKSQTIESVERYGKSYLFQKSDPLFTRPAENEYLVLVVIDVNNLTAEIYGCMRAIDVITSGGIGEPVVPHLRETKCAIYVDDLVKLLTVEQRWRI